MKKIWRRSLLQDVGAAGTVGSLGLTDKLAMSQAVAEGSSASRTLALIGDWYHSHYTANYYDLSASLLKPYQLFICSRDNMIWPGG